MSITKWFELGQWSRELTIYNRLAEMIGKVVFYSYGYSEGHFVNSYPNLSIISKTGKIWQFLPRRFNRRVDRFWNAWNLFKHKELFKSVDIIKTNQFYAAQWGLILKNIFNKKLVIRMGFYHTHIWDLKLAPAGAYKFLNFSSSRWFAEKKYFTSADGIIVTNPKAKDYIINKYKLNPGKIICLPNAIDCSVFKPLDMKQDIDILYVGRLHEKKNLKLLLNAVKKLSISPRVVFIGQGPQKAELLQIAEEDGINLEIIDRVDNYELARYYNRAKVFVLPSFYEGNPKVLMEAMACGCVTVATDVPGIKEIVKNSETGFLVSLSSDEMADVIKDILCNYSAYRNSVGKRAREYIVDTCDLDKVVKREAEFLFSL